MNTKIYFNYRDGANYKDSSGPFILKGVLSKEKEEELNEGYGDVGALLIPNQIHPSLKNACPSLKGLRDSTSNHNRYDEEFDHPYHTINLEQTNEEPNVPLTVTEFYNILETIDFDEMHY